MYIPTAADFKFHRTWTAARDLAAAFAAFLTRSALDRHAAVQLVLHELAAEALEEIGQRPQARDIRYRQRGLREQLDTALQQLGTKRRYRRRADSSISAPPEPAASVTE